MKHGTVVLVFAGLLATANVAATVTDAAENGFTVRHEIAVVAPPETVWRMLVGHVGEWWHDDHTYSGDASNLYIETRPLGCFCERLAETDAVVHLTVTVIMENSLLRLTGGLGPLGLLGVDGNMTFSLGNDGDTTRMAVEYRVGGYSPDGLDSLAGDVDGVLGAQLERFVRFVETGSADKENHEEAPREPSEVDHE